MKHAAKSRWNIWHHSSLIDTMVSHTLSTVLQVCCLPKAESHVTLGHRAMPTHCAIVCLSCILPAAGKALWQALQQPESTAAKAELVQQYASSLQLKQICMSSLPCLV